MSGIFLSHSSSDNDAALRISRWLEQQGYRSQFLDFDPERGIPAGRDWEKELYAQLRTARAVIVLCSEHSMSSPWCFAEITHARALGKALFPLKIDNCKIHNLLNMVQLTDLSARPDEGLDRLARGLKAAGLNPANSFDWDGTRAPYPGLLAFDESDAAIFFGRENEIREGLDTLDRQRRFGGARIVLLLGASGSGKSSLLRAGVIPRLRRNPEQWLIVPPFRPLGRPVENLAYALAESFNEAGKPREWRELRNLIAAANHAHGLVELATELRFSAHRPNATVLISVDQLEELLTLGSSEEAHRFLVILREGAESAAAQILINATLRSDFLGAVQTQTALRDLSFVQLLVNPMSHESIGQVIEGPALVMNLELEPGLAQMMLQDINADGALPLLAFTLRELWEQRQGDKLTIEVYRDQLGGLAGAVARAAEKVLEDSKAMSGLEEIQLRQAFLSLVRVNDEGHFTRRPARWADLPEQIYPLLERFVQARLLISRQDDMGRVLEVAHEALFRSWARLARWLDADRAFLLWRKRLDQGVEIWNQGDKSPEALLTGPLLRESESYLKEQAERLSNDERDLVAASVSADRRSRRIRTCIAGLIGVVIILFGGISFREYLLEKEQRDVAVAQELMARARATGVDQYDLFALLAIESSRLAPLLENESALRQATMVLPQKELNLERDFSGRRVVFSDDDRYVANVTWGDKIVARVFDTASCENDRCKELYRLPLGDPSQFAAMDGPPLQFGLGGHYFVALSADKTARVFELNTGKEVSSMKYNNEVIAVAVSPDAHYLATGGMDKTIKVFEAATGKQLWSLVEDDAVLALSFSSDGRRVVTGSIDNSARVIEAGKEVSRLTCDGPVRAVAFSPDGRYVAIGSDDKTARVFEAATRKEVSKLTQLGSVYTVAFSPDGRYVATGGEDGTARVFEAATGYELWHLNNRYQVNAVAFSSDGRHLAIVSGDEMTVRVYNTAIDKELWRLANDGRVEVDAFSPDGRYFATGSDDKTARVFDAATGKERLRLIHQGPVRAMAFSPDGRYFATGSDDKTARVFDTVTGKERLRLTYETPLRAVALSSDARYLATGGDDKTVQVFDTGNGKRVLVLRQRGSLVGFSPDGRYLTTFTTRPSRREPGISVSYRMFEIATGREGQPLKHTDRIDSVAFSHDGRYVAVGSLVLRTASGEPLWSRPQSGTTNAVAFSRDGRYLAIAAENSIRVFQAATGDELLELANWSPVRALAFSSDSSNDGARVPINRFWSSRLIPRYMLTADVLIDGKAEVIVSREPLGRTDLITEVCSLLTRNLTPDEWKQYMRDAEPRKTCPNLP